jgi:DNA-binding response OmpR family regulator
MKLLIVEDEVRIADNLKKGFMQESFDVEVAYEGETGINSAVRNTYDLIILDLMLPKVNGLTILRRMREKKVFTPVIILTAKDSVDDKVEGLDIGADDYVAKPFSFEELLSRVKAIIRRVNTKVERVGADDLEMDQERQIVSRNGKIVDLSGTEYKILEYLLVNKGAILSEEKIINHVWNHNADVYSNVVASHMKNLRQKIDKNFPDSTPLIKTIRGMGYRINEQPV